jgi:hypothetical protein
MIRSFEAVPGLGLSEAKRDRVARARGSQRCSDLLEARSRFSGCEVRHRAKELIASVTDEHVVATEVGAKRVAQQPEQSVAGEVAMTVIHVFCPVPGYRSAVGTPSVFRSLLWAQSGCGPSGQ